MGDAGVRGTAQQPRLYVGMILVLIFAEVLGTLESSIGCCLSIVFIADTHSRPLRNGYRDASQCKGQWSYALVLNADRLRNVPTREL